MTIDKEESLNKGKGCAYIYGRYKVEEGKAKRSTDYEWFEECEAEEGWRKHYERR
ncbi:hypothetical protein LCGC14_0439290 [marine sediment metagenome]|uniref:Uncharacterized protein n=1 Tax=marine sediment metagenome TaxID=412755 RepID=A0A0F9V7U8_9ZZZZ